MVAAAAGQVVRGAFRHSQQLILQEPAGLFVSGFGFWPAKGQDVEVMRCSWRDQIQWKLDAISSTVK